MGLRDKVIKEENRSFLVSDDEKYDDPQDFVRYQVHGPIRNQYVITEHEFGSLGRTSVLDIRPDGLEAIEFAYLQAKKYLLRNLNGRLLKYLEHLTK